MRARVAGESGGAPDFPLLADPDFAVINRYGVCNPAGFDGRRVPHPAVFVIDRAGRVTWRFPEYRRPDPGGERGHPGGAGSDRPVRREGRRDAGTSCRLTRVGGAAARRGEANRIATATTLPTASDTAKA